jgi:hypothetical protein
VLEPGYEVWVVPRNRSEDGSVPGMTGPVTGERLLVVGERAGALTRSRARGSGPARRCGRRASANGRGGEVFRRGHVGSEVTAVGPQLGMRSDRPGAADDQPPVATDDLSDLRLTLLGLVLDRLASSPGSPRESLSACAHRSSTAHPAVSKRLKTSLFQNPESARHSLTPLARVRVGRAISSSQKRSIPLLVLADPLRSRICNPSGVSAPVARIG